MVARRLGTQSRRLPALGAPGSPPQTSATERLAPGSPSPGWGCSQALAHTSKGSLKREFSPVGSLGCSEQESGPQTRLLAPRLGRPQRWTRGERRRSLRALRASLRLRTSAH